MIARRAIPLQGRVAQEEFGVSKTGGNQHTITGLEREGYLVADETTSTGWRVVDPLLEQWLANGRSSPDRLDKASPLPLQRVALTAMARGYASTVPAEVRRLGRDQDRLTRRRWRFESSHPHQSFCTRTTTKKEAVDAARTRADSALVDLLLDPRHPLRAAGWFLDGLLSRLVGRNGYGSPQFGTEQRVERLGQHRSAEGSQRAGMSTPATTCSPVSPDSSRNAT